MLHRTILIAGLTLSGVSGLSAYALGVLPLSALLLAAPLAGMALLPWSSPWIALIGFVVATAFALWIPLLPGAELRTRYHGQLSPGIVALRFWGFIGVSLMSAALALRIGAMIPIWWLNIPVAIGIFVIGLLAASPLGMLYLPQHSDADAIGVAAETVREDLVIAGADGVRLHARMYVPRDREWHGLIVFSHGFGGWKEAFLNHLHLFNRAGWAVLAYDLRGCGRSSPSACSYGARETEDLLAVWYEAKLRAAGRPMVAYGVSLGGSITRLAAARLDGCRAVILESPFTDLGQMIGTLNWPTRMLAVKLPFIGLGWDPRAIRPIDAPTPDAPTLVGWVVTDRTIPAEQSAAVAAQLSAQVVTLPTGEHLDMIVAPAWRWAVVENLNRAAGMPPPRAEDVGEHDLLMRYSGSF